MKCFSVENNPWENKNIVVPCSVFVGVVFFVSFLFFFLLLSSFKTNDKKEFSNKDKSYFESLNNSNLVSSVSINEYQV